MATLRRRADRGRRGESPRPACAGREGELQLPVSTVVADYTTKGDRSLATRLPEKWTEEFAHYLGWLLGDGCLSGNIVSTIYGNADDQADVLPRHRELVSWMNGDWEPKPSVQTNGTIQLRQGRRPIARFLEALGIGPSKAAGKRTPWAVDQAPPDIVAAFLQGLFDADGCVYNGLTSRYVGLGSASRELLVDVQRLFEPSGSSAGSMPCRRTRSQGFSYVGKGRVRATICRRPAYDLRISNTSIEQFAGFIGFSIGAKHEKLAFLC